MKQILKKESFIFFIASFLFIFYLWGILLVPFHPDESTQIYVSQDFFDIIDDPRSLAMTPGTELSPRDVYRALDAPLARYLIGLTRFIIKKPGLAANWNWSDDWNGNLANGAYPSPSLLFTARFLPTLLIPFSICFFYFTARKLIPKLPAVIASLFLGLNPLVLLHCRRAMAESALLFGVTFFLWTVTQDKIRLPLVGFGLAIAVNSKQTAAALIPVGIIAVCLQPDDSHRLRNMLARVGLFGAIFGITSFLLNPFYWRAPVEAIYLSYKERSLLLQMHAADHLSGFKINLVTLVYSLVFNLFISPPIPAEVGNFLTATFPSAQRYFSIFPHLWGRSLFAGSLQITIILGSIYVLFKRYSHYDSRLQRKLLLLSLSTLFLIIIILFTPPIPWQRYVIPLLPLAAFWLGYGLIPINDSLVNPLRGKLKYPTILIQK